MVQLLGSGSGLARRPERGRQRRPRPDAADRGPAAGRPRRRWRSVRHRRASAARRAHRLARRPASRHGSRRSAPDGRYPCPRGPVPTPPARSPAGAVRRRGTCRWPSPSASASPRCSCCCSNFGERYVVGLVAVALAVAGVEFFDTVRSKGYQPAQFIGLAAIIGLPLAAYWVGVDALPLLIVLAFVATAVWGMASGQRRQRAVAERRHHDARRRLHGRARLLRGADPALAQQLGQGRPAGHGRRRGGQRHRRAVRRLERGPHAGRGLDQPQQDRRGPGRRGVPHHHRPGRRQDPQGRPVGAGKLAQAAACSRW